MKKRNFIINLLLTGAIVLSGASCQNDENVKPKPDGEALAAAFEKGLDDRTQSFTVDATNGGTITGTQGTKIFFGAKAFLTADGDTVAGNVTVELIELYKRGDMLLTRQSTNGKMPDGKISTLITGGEFYINATKDGLQLKPTTGFTIMAPTANTGVADTEMALFDGELDCQAGTSDCDPVWVENDRAKVDVDGDPTGGGQGTNSAYWTFQSNFGWTNIDKWYSDPRPKTTIYVEVPNGYDNSNCAVYLAYKGEPNALARFDVYNSGTGLFTEHYGLVPIGLEVHFIFVSIVDGNWHYAIQSTTITANHHQVITNVLPTTEASLTALISALP